MAGTASSAAALEDGLRIDADATYDIDVESGSIRVTVDLTLTNVTPNETTSTSIIRYYFDGFGLAVPAEAENLVVTSNGTSLSAELSDGESGFFKLADVSFPNLFYRNSRRLLFEFDLVGAPPRSEESFVRVNPAFVSFFAWAYGDPGRGSVVIRSPLDLRLEVEGDHMQLRLAESGGYEWYAEGIDQPDLWGVLVTGWNDGNLARGRLELDETDVAVQYWPGDDEWRDRVVDAMQGGIPALTELTGLEWPVEGRLRVRETMAPNLLGYAGWYLQDTNLIEMGETLDDHVILHEVAHVWFNEDLFDSRWINEGLADVVAAAVAEELFGDAYEPEAIRATRVAVPLNEWDVPDFGDDDFDAREDYGYNASWFVVDEMVDQLGPDGLRAVLLGAAEDRIAYVGAVDVESVDRRDDWRRFLDLAEEAGADVSDLFFDHVVADRDLDEMEERSAARVSYAELEDRGGEWLPPPLVRLPMAEWAFDEATAAVDEAVAVLERRDERSAEASDLGLIPSPAMEAAYETADWDVAAAMAIAGADLAALDAIAAAEAAADVERDRYVELGIVSPSITEDLRQMRKAFESGDAAEAEVRAAMIADDLAGAEARGRRAFTATVVPGGIALTVLLVAAGGGWVRWRARRREIADEAEPIVVGELVSGDGEPAVGEDPATGRADAAAALDDPPDL